MNKVRRCAVLAAVVLACVSGARALAQSAEQQKLVAVVQGADDRFGSGVAVSGDTAVVGAFFDECAPDTPCGAAYVYRFNGTSWDQEQKLTASDDAEADWFGKSVALSGDTVVVGANGDDCAAGFKCGAAYVFRFNGTSWVEEQKLIASDAGSNNSFGHHVSVSGDAILVGGTGADCAEGGHCGAAYVFRFNGTSWDEEQKLTASDTANDNQFGISVSVSGDTALVGARFDECPAGGSCGAAYIFRFNGTSWDEEQKLTASDAAHLDNYGFSVSVSGDTALVGAAGHACAAGKGCGSAYVYRFNGSSWVEQKLTASDAGADDFFGVSVSVSGDTAVAGAWEDECAAGERCGSAYLFRFNGTSWVEQEKLTASDAGADDYFGVSVSMDGDTVAVGSWWDDCPAGGFCGAAYVFHQSGVEPVPTVSEWGVAVMALLTLTAGTLVLARRRTAALGC